MEEAAEWLGATILRNIPDENFFNRNTSEERIPNVSGYTNLLATEKFIIVTIVTFSLSEYLRKKKTVIFVSPYFISKLLRANISIPDYHSFFEGRTEEYFQNLIYTPVSMAKSRDLMISRSDSFGDFSGLSPRSVEISKLNDLKGRIFAISGFIDYGPDSSFNIELNDLSKFNNLSKSDIIAGVTLLGGHVSRYLVENATSYLICKNMSGIEYETARKWGENKIKIVDWLWLLECVKNHKLFQTFENNFHEESCYSKKENLIEVINKNEKACCIESSHIESTKNVPFPSYSTNVTSFPSVLLPTTSSLPLSPPLSLPPPLSLHDGESPHIITDIKTEFDDTNNMQSDEIHREEYKQTSEYHKNISTVMKIDATINESNYNDNNNKNNNNNNSNNNIDNNNNDDDDNNNNNDNNDENKNDNDSDKNSNNKNNDDKFQPTQLSFNFYESQQSEGKDVGMYEIAVNLQF